MMTSEKQLVTLAKDYSAKSGLSLSTLGRLIVNDGKFFGRISKDGGCTMDTYHRVVAWFSANSPQVKTKKPKR